VGGASLVVVLVLPGVITILGRPYHATSGSAAPPVMGAIVTPGESRDKSTVPVSTPYGELNGVSCSSRHACMAVGVRFNLSGTRQETTAELWNGRAWMLTAIRDPAGSAIAALRGVSCPTASDCLAVGHYLTASQRFVAIAEAWNGRVWRLIPTPAPLGRQLVGVSCSSARSCTAVGSSITRSSVPSALVERWNGARWEVHPHRPRRSPLARRAAPWTPVWLSERPSLRSEPGTERGGGCSRLQGSQATSTQPRSTAFHADL
jgi:hypothetical protein